MKHNPLKAGHAGKEGPSPKSAKPELEAHVEQPKPNVERVLRKYGRGMLAP